MRIPALILAIFAAPLQAHELWIEPLEFQISPENMIRGQVVNGEGFDGSPLAYIPRTFNRFVVVSGSEFANVLGRLGDRPALNTEPLSDGLHVVAYISNPLTIDYANWEKFQKFVDHKDLGDVRPLHEARDLPLEGFDEVYTRFSKSLVGVGSAQGADRPLGMETELVALTNPYVEPTDTMQLQLLYQRDVRASEQIEIFEKGPDGYRNVFLVRTDENGIAQVPVKSGFTYMADAVVLREPSEALAASSGADWETLWANITWAMP